MQLRVLRPEGVLQSLEDVSSVRLRLLRVPALSSERRWRWRRSAARGGGRRLVEEGRGVVRGDVLSLRFPRAILMGECNKLCIEPCRRRGLRSGDKKLGGVEAARGRGREEGNDFTYVIA
jgi:hypothetical protein